MHMFPDGLAVFALVAPLLFLCTAVRAIEVKSEHPRLLFTKTRQQEIETLAQTDTLLARLIAHNQLAAEKAVKAPVVAYRIPDGKRLLGESRKCIRTVTTTAMAYRLTGDERFARRAVKDMLAAAAFKDWNPKHFLDTAEMTTALAIGYDWLYDVLSEEERRTIRAAIVKHGLKPGMQCYTKGGWWVRGHNNWNQVCNGGMTMGALAIAENEPELAEQVVRHALKSLPNGMGAYIPDGAYPEGPGYWHYGTVYNVIMVDALQTAAGSDFGIAGTKAFDRTGMFWVHSVSPAGYFFNYADGGSGYRPGPVPFKLATLYDQPLLAWWHRDKLRGWLDRKRDISNRFLALEIAWYDPRGDTPTGDELPLDTFFRGHQDVVMMRGAWGDPNAVYVGFKGGDNRASHGHLDLGSFVLDAEGCRWALDLGGDNYNMPAYFGGKRWTYYRLNNRSHNTLVIGDKLQNTKAKADVTHFETTPERTVAVVDLAAAYKDQAKAARRGLALLDRKAVLVQDELTAPAGRVRWGMMTGAEVKLDGAEARLTQKGKTLHARILEPEGARFEVVSTKPPTSRENPNKGTRMLAIHVEPGESPELRIAVLLCPGRHIGTVTTPNVIPLKDW
jgi:hypothetical protein